MDFHPITGVPIDILMQIVLALYIPTVSPKDQQSWFYSLLLLPVKIPVRFQGGLKTIGEKELKRPLQKLGPHGKSWINLVVGHNCI
jgi:hypothetical protein